MRCAVGQRDDGEGTTCGRSLSPVCRAVCGQLRSATTDWPPPPPPKGDWAFALLPSLPPCPACFFDGAAVDGSFVIVAGSVQFRNGNGMGAWQKGEHRNERRN